MAQFRFIDLFAGIGGFRLALESKGGTCVGFSEIAPDAIHAYCTNFGEKPECNLGDITRLTDLPEHDFMTAGVPCQSWSIAGKNLGFDDDRGQLWNDTLYLLNKTRPKAFIFENVKGLADPRNEEALNHIMSRIKEAGYHAAKFLLNAYDYGVPQTRVRIYIIGFKEKKYFDRFLLPPRSAGRVQLSEVLDDACACNRKPNAQKARWSLSCNSKGFNTYFLFNDLRNGDTTIHSWDILDTTQREKDICMLLLRNRRKRDFGKLDGNPLSLEHFQSLDATITLQELEKLVDKGILKKEAYLFRFTPREDILLSAQEQELMAVVGNGGVVVDDLKTNRTLKMKKVSVLPTLESLTSKGIAQCIETRYDFKNTKISTGLFGVNRIFLPSSDIYPTLVASDTNDYISPIDIDCDNIEDYRRTFLTKVYRTGNYRQITKAEACRIQGFPDTFSLPESRARWMKLVGNSVAVNMIRQLAQAIIDTGVFADIKPNSIPLPVHAPKPYRIEPQQLMMVFEPRALYYAIEKPTLLIGCCRQGQIPWIKENNLYNYPILEEEMDRLPQLKKATRLIIRHKKTDIGYYRITNMQIVDRAGLAALGYPTKSSNHKVDTKYILYTLTPLKKSAPQLTSKDCRILLGKAKLTAKK